MSTILFALYCAVVAVVFASVRPGLFTPWFDLLLWLETKGRLGKWLSKPLGLCHLCAAGQLALWAHLYASGWNWRLWPAHILCSCAAILFASVTNSVYEWSKVKPR